MNIDRASRWVEILANIGVLATLLFLAIEVRNNTRTLQRQAVLDRSHVMNYPFLESPQLAAILAEVKAVDGWGGAYETAFAERYETSIENGIVWARHLSMVWAALQADFALLGESNELAERVQLLLSFPDNQLWWERSGEILYSPEFHAYVERIREAS